MYWRTVPAAIVIMGSMPLSMISIHARDSLSIRKDNYSALYFVAEPAHMPDNDLPVQYRFTESGTPPSGMKFENYPCNKPDQKACPQLASANGVYLDGTPSESGSYNFVITASDGTAEVSQQFTVTVTSEDRRK